MDIASASNVQSTVPSATPSLTVINAQESSSLKGISAPLAMLINTKTTWIQLTSFAEIVLSNVQPANCS